METNADVKILLVDDREDNLFSMEELLSNDGYRFVKATSGMEALKVLLKEYDFTLILMDVQMPGIDGFETAKMIYERERLKHIPIIFISGAEYSETLLFKGFKTGGVDYIYKPVNPDLLRAKVSVFVDLYHKNHLLIAQEEQLQKVNKELENRVKERTEELVHKNQELEWFNSELKRVNNDLDSFVYTASHDLKSPISNIEGLLNTLETTIPAEVSEMEEVKGIFEMIDLSMHKFKSTINDLTEITKVQQFIKEEKEEIDLLDLIKDVEVNLNELIKNADAKIFIDVKQCPKVKFSKKNLNSILQNLISNGIKYRSPERKSEIRITASRFEDYVLIKVQDNGIGIKPEDKDKVFSIFIRFNKDVEGTGVGLYIVKKILDGSGGKIELESQPGVGSLFKVFIKN